MCVRYLAQLHEDIDDAQEIGGGKSGAGVAAGHVVFVQRSLPLAQPTPATKPKDNMYLLTWDGKEGPCSFRRGIETSDLCDSYEVKLAVSV